MSYPGYTPPSYGFTIDQQQGPMHPSQPYGYPSQPAFTNPPYPAGPSYGGLSSTNGATYPLSPYPLTHPSSNPQSSLPYYPTSTPHIAPNPSTYPPLPIGAPNYPLPLGSESHNPVAPSGYPPGYPPSNNSYQPGGALPYGSSAYNPNLGPSAPTMQQPHYPQQTANPSNYVNNIQAVTSFQQSSPEQIPTVFPANPFDPRSDAERLKRAMKGLGTDESALIDVLCRRTASQRCQISQMYKSMYGKDLKSSLKSELSFNFLRLMVALTYAHHEFLACELHEAMKGLGTREHTLIEILCSSRNQDVASIKAAYQRLFNQSLENDIRSDTSGDFCRILIALAQGQRDECQPANVDLARQDAQRLYTAGEGRVGTDESTFINIFVTRSWNQLILIAAEYQKLRGRTLDSAVRSEFSGWIQTALVDILSCASNRNAYFARRLKESMAGAGTRDRDLIRLIVSRCDQDLASIKREYQTHYGHSLSATIANETSGDYKRGLLILIG